MLADGCQKGYSLTFTDAFAVSKRTIFRYLAEVIGA
jgi:hypothetical protein